MLKLAQKIVKYRIFFAIFFIVLTVAGIVGSFFVNRNYDMVKYLPENTDTKKGMSVMGEEFGLNNIILVMIDVEETDVDAYKNKLSGISNVMLVSLDSYKDGKALFMLTLDGDQYDDKSKQVIDELHTLLDGENYELSGGAVSSYALENALGYEIPIILIIAIVVIALVLLFTSHSWFEPVVFACVLFCAVMINMGSNIIFGEISYITFAVSAILQLALAMDYSIILLHGFSERRWGGSGMDKEQALVEALAYNMRPISSSGLTTIAGLIALLFMSFSIGFDIGIVLAKGILVSLLSVFLLMPALIMIFDKPLEKTRHKPVPLGGGHIANASVKARFVLPALMVAVIVGAYILQLGNVYSFSGWDTFGGKDIEKTFGYTNQAVLLFDAKYADDKDAQDRFTAKAAEILNEDGSPAVKRISAWTDLKADGKELSSQIDVSELKPYLTAMFGSDATVGDLVTIWDGCQNDIFALEIPKEVFALMTDQSVDAVYDLLRGSNGKVTVGSTVERIALLADSALFGSVIKEKLPQNVIDAVKIINGNRDEFGRAAASILTPVLQKMTEKYGEDALLADIEIDTEGIFKKLCKLLFDDEKLDVFLIYRLLQTVGSIMDAPLATYDGTLKEYIYEVRQSDDGSMEWGICTIADMLQDEFAPAVSEMLGSLLGTLRTNFVGKSHGRIIIILDLPEEGEETFAAIDALKAAANECFGDDNLIAGQSMTIKDISSAFGSDLLKINLMTILTILLIIGVLFRSVSLPVILVLVIQGAIWITMAIYAIIGQPIFFMSYIICLCIQMGATIDYGILIASNYRRNREKMGRKDSIIASVKTAMPTIVTSGLILTAAAFIIGFVSSVMPIYSIGFMLGTGTIVSILLIMFLLPSTLYILDPLITRTTWDGVKVFDEKNDTKKA